MINKWWKAEPAGRKFIWVTACVLFLGLIVATIWSLLLVFGGPQKIETGNTRPATSSKPSKEGGETESESPAEGPINGNGTYQFVVDNTGMAVMPVTTDPAEAAAGAAAVKFNVDTTKFTAVEFAEEAARRMTHPSPEYVGPDLTIETGLKAPQEANTPEESVRLGSTSCLQVSDRQCALWPMLSSSNFDMYRAEGLTITGTPTLVMSESEMREWYPKAIAYSDDLNASNGVTPVTEGATLTWWFVVTDVQDRLIDENSSQEVASLFAIWCDPPQDGGLCGVAFSMVNGSMPESWPHRSR